MKSNYYAARAQAAYAAAEAATDPRDKAAWRAAAQTWERLANPREGGYSMEPDRQQLAAIKKDIANAVDAPTGFIPVPAGSFLDPHAHKTVEAIERAAPRYIAKHATAIDF